MSNHPGLLDHPIHMSRSDKARLPYTPDEISIPLILGALRLLAEPAEDVIALKERVDTERNRCLAKGKTLWTASWAAGLSASDFTMATVPGEETPWYPDPITGLQTVRFLVDRIYDACFVLISYLVGMRISEILGLEAGCIERERSLDGSEQFVFIKGRIFKTAAHAGGAPHRWIAPPIVERVIEVLERLSARIRAKAGKTHLWLKGGSTGWVSGKQQQRIEILPSPGMVYRLNSRFGPFVDLPGYRGKPWHLTTHQGRKTFARYVAKQDRTGLHALKEHFGHRSILMTDQAYAGVDYEIGELIDEVVQEEMVTAFAEVLTAKRLGGTAGARIAAQSPFRGQLVEEGALSFARARLNDTNMTFEVCDYGFCYYSRRHSACHGNDHGSNSALRTQSTCVTCKNFVVAPKHIPIWIERRNGYVDFLSGDEIESTLREDIERKVEECNGVLAQLEDAK